MVWTSWFLALSLYGCSYAPYIRFLSHWWVLWGMETEKAEHVLLVSFYV